ncbi:NCS2 family permease [Rouxiella badensis]|jgi:AGZA family xanthine/uracil permease-like MFS transporter|uniref:NCS2 family permease n=1 Tax=Rouxiella badensis TaxID=1646377 RepID=UPI001787FCE2|nr:NCS2 family permease [Rouxiella badensis]MCC3702194.1 NCS2 family permease [Rouxiella badensis]QOI53855.1 NCS2 family permease [Rouxiella badensis subsp. acadiensis]
MADTSVKSTSPQAEGSWLQRRFKLNHRQTTVKTECLAGVTGFLAAAYLLVVIPGLLSVGGIDKGAALTGTIIILVVGSLLMAFYANLPFMVGPGIGGSVLVGITLAGDGISWPIGLGIACWSGILFFVLTVLGLREVVTRSVPQSIKLGLTASIGIFVALLGFRNAGLVIANAKTHALGLGDFTAPGALIALLGLMVAIGLQARRVPGALLWAILLATLAGIPFGITHLPGEWIALPHSVGPLLGKIDLFGALNIAFLPFLFIFFASEFFSTMGTTLAVGGEAGLLDEQGNMNNINRPFVVDSIAAALGPIFGIPAATALIESAAAAEAGGKTGLTALAAALMFLLTLLLTPVALMIPKEATAPALILIGLNMFSGLRKVDLANFTEGLPVLMMVMATLISNSFGTGIAAGLLFYVAIKVVAGKAREVPIGLYVLAIPLVYYFATLTHH